MGHLEDFKNNNSIRDDADCKIVDDFKKNCSGMTYFSGPRVAQTG